MTQIEHAKAMLAANGAPGPYAYFEADGIAAIGGQGKFVQWRGPLGDVDGHVVNDWLEFSTPVTAPWH